MMNVGLKTILGWLAAIVVALVVIPTSQAKTTKPKLLSIKTVEFEETSDEIFSGSIPYIHLAQMHKDMVLRYKNPVVNAIAKHSQSEVDDYHVKRAAMSEEPSKGYNVIYYETIYNKEICEVSAVTVDRSGNFSVKTALC